MEKYTEFCSLIEEFLELFDELTAVEQKKLDAAVKNQVTFVEECMKKEQAFVLQLRGLEQRRESQQEALGMKALTFREILEKVPSEVQEKLQPLFQELSKKVRDFQSINENAKDAITINLHKIQGAMKSTPEKNQFYSASGQKSPEENHFTNRSV